MKLLSRKLFRVIAPIALEQFEKAHGKYDKSRHKNLLSQFLDGHPLVRKRKLETARRISAENRAAEESARDWANEEHNKAVYSTSQ